MVCRDAFTYRAYPVNALSVYTPEESALNAMGEGEPNISPSLLHTLTVLGTAHHRHRLSRAQRSLSLVPPSSTQAKALRDFSLRYAAEPFDPSCVWMGDTRLERVMLMFPQERKCVSFPVTELAVPLNRLLSYRGIHQKVFRVL